VGPDPAKVQQKAILDSGCGYLLVRDLALCDAEYDAALPPVDFIAGVGAGRLKVESEQILFAVITDAKGHNFYLRSRALLVPELSSPILIPEAPFLQGCPKCSREARCDAADETTINKTLWLVSVSGKLVDVQFKTDGRAVYPTHLTPITRESNPSSESRMNTILNMFSAKPRGPQIEPVETAETHRAVDDEENPAGKAADALAITEYSAADFEAHVGHLILGHQSPHNIEEAIKNNRLTARKSNPIGSSIGETLRRLPCEACLRTKTTTRPRPRFRRAHAVKPYEVLHLDVIYPPHDDTPKDKPDSRPEHAAPTERPKEPPKDKSKKSSGKATLAKGVFDGFLPAIGDRKTRYLLLAVDEATKMAHVKPMPDRSNDSIALAFRYIEHDIRGLMAHTCLVNAEGARERGYSMERCRNFKRSLIARVHGDREMHRVFGRRPVDQVGYRDPTFEAQLITGLWDPVLEYKGVYEQGGAPTLTMADPNEPWINGLAERRHNIIDGNAQASLLTAKLGVRAYHYAYINAAYNTNLGTTTIPVYEPNAAQNDVPTSTRSTPLYEATGVIPDLNKLPVHAFGATCFPHVKQRETARAHQPPRSVGIFLHPREYPHRDMIIIEITKKGCKLQMVGPTTVVNDKGLLADSIKSRLDVLGAEIASSSRGAQEHRVNFEAPDDPRHQSASDFFRWLENELPTADKALNEEWGRAPAPTPQITDPAQGAPPSGGDRTEDADQGDDGDTNGDQNESGREPVTDSNVNGTESDEERLRDTQHDEQERGHEAQDVPSPPPVIRKSARLRDKEDSGANVGDAHHVADTAPTGEDAKRRIDSLENDASTRFATAEDEYQYNMVMAMTATECHLLDLVNNKDETQGPENWLDSHIGLAEMQSTAAGLVSRGEADRHALAYSIRAAADASARRTEAEVTSEEWNAARLKEFTSLKKRGVFELATNIPAGTRIIDVKEVRSVRPDGSVKIRLVARGFRQVHGHNFTQTHSSVASPSSIMTLIGVAASRGWNLFTADCASAYLQSLMDEDVYCRLPPEWDTLADDGNEGGTKKTGRVYRLVKSVYGLKQSGRNWANHLKEHFQKVGLVQSDTDRSVHYLKDSNGKIKLLLATVVDDILATGEKETFDAVIAELTEAGIDFDQPSIGLAKSFNGMRIEQPEPHLITLDQEQYINELNETYSESYPDWEYTDSATLPTTVYYERALTDEATQPRKTDAKRDELLSQSPGLRAHFLKRYQHLLGALLWPARITRPDLAYVTGIAGQCAHQPKTSHLLALEHLLSYAVNTKDKKIVVDCRENPRRTSLSLFTDADHAGCHDTRKSRSGVVVFMNGAPISWQSKKQTLLTNSTMASETVAAYTGLQKLREPMELLREFGFTIDRPPLFCDNGTVLQHAIDDAPQPGTGTKHLSLYTKILREACIRFGDFHPFYVDTKENPADIFTKAIPSGKDAGERWNLLESRIRGEPADSTWIAKLIAATRKKENNRTPIAMELTNNIRSPKDYLVKTGWDKIADAFAACNTDICHQCVGDTAHALKATSEERRSWASLGLPKRFKGLEIFCGENGSAQAGVRRIYRGCDDCEIDFRTLDNNCKCNPDFCVDILDWNPLEYYKPGELDFVWISIPCVEYSRALTTRQRDLEKADRIAIAALKVLFTLLPKTFAIENPKGLFRDRPFMAPLRRFLKSCSYCMFIDWDANDVPRDIDYRKETDIFTNITVELPNCRTTPCAYKRKHGDHPQHAQRGPSKNGEPGMSLEDLHKVPIGLMTRLLFYGFGDVEKYDDTYKPSGDDEYSKAIRNLIIYADLHK
jgi:hypothetical protein